MFEDAIGKLVTSLMTQAGITPAHLMQAYQLVMQWQAEIDAFKAGAGAVVNHFNSRLDAIERGQAMLSAQLDALLKPLPVQQVQPINGAITHERSVE